MQLPEHINLLGVVLAGGYSSRMGFDKAQLLLQGKPMLERTADLLKSVGAAPVIICRNEKGYLMDKYPNSGPVAAIYTALDYLLSNPLKYLAPNKLNAILILPVDMPLLNQSTLQELVLCGSEMHCALHFKDQPLPLFLPINDEARECAKLIAHSNKRSVKRFVNSIGCASITTDCQDMLINTNDPLQWQQAIERFNH
ncbi:molybdenum cofactor guanylyltransferase [Colwellia sp. MEBiC06753]